VKELKKKKMKGFQNLPIALLGFLGACQCLWIVCECNTVPCLWVICGFMAMDAIFALMVICTIPEPFNIYLLVVVETYFWVQQALEWKGFVLPFTPH
jgi:hypothetical protein